MDNNNINNINGDNNNITDCNSANNSIIFETV